MPDLASARQSKSERRAMVRESKILIKLIIRNLQVFLNRAN